MRVFWAVSAVSLLLLIAAGCGGGSDSSESSALILGQDTEMRVGQTRRIAGTSESVTLVRVVTDSRCPANALCVSAGTVEAEARITRRTAPTVERTYSISFAPTTTGQDFPTPYEIQIRSALPVKETDTPPISQDKYRLTIRITSEN